MLSVLRCVAIDMNLCTCGFDNIIMRSLCTRLFCTVLFSFKYCEGVELLLGKGHTPLLRLLSCENLLKTGLRQVASRKKD